MCPIKMSKVESTLRIVLEFSEAFNRHDVAGMMKLMHADCVLERASPPPAGSRYAGTDAVAGVWQVYFEASPEASLAIEEIFSMGFRCVLRWKLHGDADRPTAEGLRGVDIFEVREGLIAEQLSYVKG